jgi:hypothetical protein
MKEEPTQDMLSASYYGSTSRAHSNNKTTMMDEGAQAMHSIKSYGSPSRTQSSMASPRTPRNGYPSAYGPAAVYDANRAGKMSPAECAWAASNMAPFVSTSGYTPKNTYGPSAAYGSSGMVQMSPQDYARAASKKVFSGPASSYTSNHTSPYAAASRYPTMDPFHDTGARTSSHGTAQPLLSYPATSISSAYDYGSAACQQPSMSSYHDTAPRYSSNAITQPSHSYQATSTPSAYYYGSAAIDPNLGSSASFIDPQLFGFTPAPPPPPPPPVYARTPQAGLCFHVFYFDR